MKAILIADTDNHLRSRFIEFFEQRGYTATGAANGREAFEVWDHDKNISIVILEVDLPEMNGLVLLDVMREFDPTVKAILMSTEYSHRAEATRRNVPFILKPFPLEALLQAVIIEIGP